MYFIADLEIGGCMQEWHIEEPEIENAFSLNQVSPQQSNFEDYLQNTNTDDLDMSVIAEANLERIMFKPNGEKFSLKEESMLVGSSIDFKKFMSQSNNFKDLTPKRSFFQHSLEK